MKKKIFSWALGLLLCGAMVFPTACGEVEEEEGGEVLPPVNQAPTTTTTTADEAVALDYGLGIAEDGAYNRDLYFINQDVATGADPGAFYVSEEEDEDWGGYYYMYITSQPMDVSEYAYQCVRSKDLVTWEPAGAYNGYAYKASPNDWSESDYWAPEVIRNPEDGKYYMYYSAQAKANSTAYPRFGANGSEGGRRMIGVAIGDSPVEFRAVGWDGTPATASHSPFDFAQLMYDASGGKFTGEFGVIDASPFLDDDGQLYMYFCKEGQDKANTDWRGSWGMKMKDWCNPDVTTMRMLARANRLSVDGGFNASTGTVSYAFSGKYNFAEGIINEGPFMVKRGGKYYLTYTGNGYGSPLYSVHQAIGDSPLGIFTKPQYNEGNPILYPAGSNVAGTGHHCFVYAGDELMIVYHRHSNPYSYNSGDQRRAISVDRVNWVTVNGKELMSANGPSFNTLQWLPESISGYKNVARTATVEVSNGSGKDYLNDGIVPTGNEHTMGTFVVDRVFTCEGETTITLKWNKAVSVRAIMIYNALDELYAFYDIDEIKFTFAEKPAWAKQNYLYGVIQNLKFPERYVDRNELDIIPNAAAVADFNEIKINRVDLIIKDKFESKDEYGEELKTINVSEIVLLGK